MISGNVWWLFICGVVLIRGGGIDFVGVGLFGGFLFICVDILLFSGGLFLVSVLFGGSFQRQE